MFCKCFFASIWEAIGQAAKSADGANGNIVAPPIVPKVKLCPIFLPAVSYLVEGDGGWMSSTYERFKQARRHTQGIAELGYVLLQYANVLLAAGITRIPATTHLQIWSIVSKMYTVHITNAVQAFSLMLGIAVGVPKILAWVAGGGLTSCASVAMSKGFFAAAGIGSFETMQWTLVAAFGPAAPVMFICACVSFFVVRDTLNGRYWNCEGRMLVAPGIQGAPKQGSLGWCRSLAIFLQIQSDYTALAEPTIVAFGLAPVLMACWSLMRNGTKFDYVVAAKPS